MQKRTSAWCILALRGWRRLLTSAFRRGGTATPVATRAARVPRPARAREREAAFQRLKNRISKERQFIPSLDQLTAESPIARTVFFRIRFAASRTGHPLVMHGKPLAVRAATSPPNRFDVYLALSYSCK